MAYNGFNLLFYVLTFFVAFTLVALITPVLSKFARQKQIVDLPGAHKTHKRAIPLLGGVGLFFGIAGTVLLFLDIDDRIISLGTGTLVLVITGLLDDLIDLRPIYKVVGQTAASSTVVLWNSYLYVDMIEYFKRFFIPDYIVLGLIIGWVVLMINAFNLIDGLDGLAAGTAAIIFAAMAVFTVLGGGNPNVLGVQVIALGACLGFLIYNFYPARIYMGDTGSMLLGFVLANVHLYTIKYPFSATLVLGSMFIFAYPVLDVSYAFYRRICNKQPLFKADQGHIHHVLISLGLSVRKTVLIIYGTNIVFSVVAVILLSLNIPSPTLMVTGVLTAVGAAYLFRRLLISGNKHIECE